jgi:putative sterol carrier protein
MASVDECRAVLDELAARLAEVDPDLRRKHTVDRTLSCHLSDLGVTFSGTLSEDGLDDVTDEPASEAQVRLTLTSDDLLALCNGDLAFASAWARGRVRIDASVLDLLRLRSLI